MQIKLRLHQTRFFLLDLVVSITHNKNLIRRKLVLGTLLLGFFVMPSCHAKRKLSCYRMVLDQKSYATPLVQSGQELINTDKDH
jgi:hypothetical protein